MQRQIILNAIKELASHPTAEEIYLHIAKNHPSISKATVYRNLASAADNGDILTIGAFDGAMRFDHNNHKHYHFICDKCKKIVDVPDFDIEAHLPSLNDLKIKTIQLTLRGLCKNCE